MPAKTSCMLVVLATIVFLTAGASDDLASRRLQIAAMAPAEQQELLRKQERFLALPAAEQNRLRTLQASIDADAHSKELLHVMARYHEWLKTLSPSERAQLGDLPPDKRVKKIKELQQRQHASRVLLHRAQLLSPDDMKAIVSWSEDVVWENRERLLTDMPEGRRQALEKLDSKKQRHALLLMVLDRSRRGGGPHALMAIEPKDIDALSAKLGEPARQELAKGANLPEQRKIVIGWIRVAMQQRADTWQASRRHAPMVDDDVAQFFGHDLKLQQDRLLKMPNDQMREELRRMYWEHEPGERGPRPNGKSFGKGGPRGPRNGRPPQPPDKGEPSETLSKP